MGNTEKREILIDERSFNGKENTGNRGTGFIGSHVVDELVKLEVEVVVLDDLSGGFMENVNKNAKFIKGSITDNKLVQSIFRENEFSYVYHLAVYAAERLSQFIKRFNYENNLMGSINLINTAIKYECTCFTFTSSIAVYGESRLPMTEDLTPSPEDSYGIAKLAVEQELKISKKTFGLNYIIFRPHNVYGERQNIGDKYRNVIGIFMNHIMQVKPLTIFGDGTQTRAFTYIKDIAPIIAKSPFVKEAYTKVFNIGADQIYTINALAEEVCKAMGVRLNVCYLPEREEVKHAYSDHSKLKEILDCESCHSLEEGLKNMASWAKNLGIRQSKKFKNIEIIRNLSPIWLE